MIAGPQFQMMRKKNLLRARSASFSEDNRVDAQDVRAKKMTALRALYDKWEAGTISNDEKDQLIKGALGVVLGR